MSVAGTRRAGIGLAGAVVALVAGACVQTSKVDDSLTPGQLAAARKGVALMRLGSASPNCLHVAVLLGLREGEGYRRHKPITVANVRSLTESPVAEVELDPGEYHIVGYSCINQKGPAVVADPANGQLYRTSYARFTLAPGEIVNVGYFHFGASREGRSLFGRPVRADVEIGDWPLEEIERFRKLRPVIYAQMTTRLMTLDAGPPSAADQQRTCDTWRKLQAEGKAAGLPPACGGPAPAKSVIHGKT